MGCFYLRAVTIESNQFGVTGERLAARWLQRKGWTILERRYRSGRRDIDLIAELGGQIAFVEVKARVGVQFGDPVEAVNWRKRRELARSAWTWIDRRGRRDEQYRFDVIGVLVSGSRVRIRHVENAFSLSLRA
jgi:putative endonuclease